MRKELCSAPTTRTHFLSERTAGTSRKISLVHSYVARESQSIKNFFSIGIEKAMLGKYLVSTYCSLGSQAKRIQIETWNAELCHISC